MTIDAAAVRDTDPRSTHSSPVSPASPASPALSTGARAGVLVLAVAVAVAVNAVIARIAVAAGVPSDYAPLTLPVFAACTALPMVVGWFAWQAIARRSSRPRRTLSILVAVVLVGSFIPDALLLATLFIPGTTIGGVVALMAMHVVVIGVAVAGYAVAGRRAQR